MRRKLLIVLLMLPAAGCATDSNASRGAFEGGVLGGLFGLAAGCALRNPAAGLALGAAGGAVAGGAIGASEDRAQRREAVAAAQAQAARQVSLTDVVNMGRAGNSDVIIINQIRSTGSVYTLTPDQITWLKNYNVSDVVITEMQSRPPGVVYRQVPYYRPAVVYADPPVVGVGVGVRIR